MKIPMNQQYGLRYRDIRLEFFRRSDGRQNTVKIIHVPTGIISEVTGEEDVSMNQVKKQAFQKLKKAVKIAEKKGGMVNAK